MNDEKHRYEYDLLNLTYDQLISFHNTDAIDLVNLDGKQCVNLNPEVLIEWFSEKDINGFFVNYSRTPDGIIILVKLLFRLSFDLNDIINELNSVNQQYKDIIGQKQDFIKQQMEELELSQKDKKEYVSRNDKAVGSIDGYRDIIKMMIDRIVPSNESNKYYYLETNDKESQ